ncbi:hypothetical protein ACHHYP_16654 [Achlya hypogyna]|uniref:Uncharacterized protein n=1 Tax=Achlya hypogyna TaxID=1202772 RepID=A0A1V9Y675_ACHHY|nr:hypothetical protein ACHHYP_16654 [Achlya hypogyna]
MAFSLTLASLKGTSPFNDVVSNVDKLRRALSTPMEDARMSALDKVSLLSTYYATPTPLGPMPVCPQTPPAYQTRHTF